MNNLTDQQTKPLVNRVKNSGLITFDLETYKPSHEFVTFDVKDYLWKELVLKEKEFRAAIKELDFEQFQDKIVLVYCSTDAIIPTWAFMLIASEAQPFAADVFMGSQEEYLKQWYRRVINELPDATYRDQRVVVKGCGEEHVPESAYIDLTKKLRPLVKSLMYGEPCSTVPVFKKKPGTK